MDIRAKVREMIDYLKTEHPDMVALDVVVKESVFSKQCVVHIEFAEIDNAKKES